MRWVAETPPPGVEDSDPGGWDLRGDGGAAHTGDSTARAPPHDGGDGGAASGDSTARTPPRDGDTAHTGDSTAHTPPHAEASPRGTAPTPVAPIIMVGRTV